MSRVVHLLCTSMLVLAAAAASEPADDPSPDLPKLSGDLKWLKPLHTRPGHTQQLTQDNFDAWVTEAVKSKKSAFVRWISTDDTSDCSWIAQRHESQGYLQPPKKEEHCKLLAKSSQQWNDVAEKYKNDNTVVFGDVVLSDWKGLVQKIQAERKALDSATEEEGEENAARTHYTEIFKQELQDLDDLYANHIDEHPIDTLPDEPVPADDHKLDDQSGEKLESGEPPEPPEPSEPSSPSYADHSFGCNIRIYSMAQFPHEVYEPSGHSPECTSLVRGQEHDEEDHLYGEAEQSTDSYSVPPTEAWNMEAYPMSVSLDALVTHTKQRTVLAFQSEHHLDEA